MMETKYYINKENGYIYEAKGLQFTESIEGVIFHINENELFNYKVIDSVDYYEILHAKKNNDYSYSNEKYLSELIETVLST